MLRYDYKPNRQVPAVPAQAVGEELERIRAKAGSLTAAAVVDASRPKKALLHKDLDLHLPPEERAELWSRHRARNVINVVTVVQEVPKGQKEAAPVPSYTNIVEGPVDDPENRDYRPTLDLLADPIQRAALVQRALEKLVRVQREYRSLKELANVWGAIDEALLAQA